MCSVMILKKRKLRIIDSFHVREIAWSVLYTVRISDTVEWKYHLLFWIYYGHSFGITVLFYLGLFYISEHFLIVYKFCISITAALN
jgi:hypothetical protein